MIIIFILSFLIGYLPIVWPVLNKYFLRLVSLRAVRVRIIIIIKTRLRTWGVPSGCYPYLWVFVHVCVLVYDKIRRITPILLGFKSPTSSRESFGWKRSAWGRPASVKPTHISALLYYYTTAQRSLWFANDTHRNVNYIYNIIF